MFARVCARACVYVAVCVCVFACSCVRVCVGALLPTIRRKGWPKKIVCQVCSIGARVRGRDGESWET